MSFQRAILSVSLLSAAILARAGDAEAQIDPGTFDIHLVGAGSKGGGRGSEEAPVAATLASATDEPVGFIYVPPREEGQSAYEEEWVSWDGEPLSPLPRSTTIEIVPRESSRLAPLPKKGARRAEATRVLARAVEYEPGPQVESCPSAEPTKPERSGTACYVTEIWQRRGRGGGASAGLMTRVGRIQSSQAEGGEGGRQEWLLSPDYIYPSPANGVITQLRPSSAPCSSSAAPPERPIARSICVELSPKSGPLTPRPPPPPVEPTAEYDAGSDGAAPELTCEAAAGPRAMTPGRRGAWSLFFVGALLALGCRRRGRQG